jgi:8-oxo-dGTP pyrophosphatase MutT (NUDIX family)
MIGSNAEPSGADDSMSEEPARRGVVAVVRRGDRLLVIRRSQTVVAPGAYCFPGGGIEPGEAEPVALEREMFEELGCRITPLRCIWRSRTPWNVDLAWWRAELHDEPVANPTEVAAVAWHSVVELAALPQLLESNHHFLAALERGEFTLD